jgi:hypothetical protein
MVATVVRSSRIALSLSRHSLDIIEQAEEWVNALVGYGENSWEEGHLVG